MTEVARRDRGLHFGTSHAEMTVGGHSAPVIALVATFNEERFIAGCIEHLRDQGVDVYLIDNESSDRTVEIAQRYVGQGVVAIETLPRPDGFSLRSILRRKEELASALDATWLLHVDADEIHLPLRSGTTLAEAFAEVDAAGYNAVNFVEFTFVPIRESPNHYDGEFRDTMRWYYAFAPTYPHRLNAWKQESRCVELAWSGGHLVRFEGLRMFPESFRMKHYLFLSPDHAIEKYGDRVRAPDELADSWGGWRNKLVGARRSAALDSLLLPSRSELRTYVSDDLLDVSNPLTRHWWAEQWASHVSPS